MGEFVLLSHDETIKLICAAKKGDKEAKERLLDCNYPLIKSIAARFKNKGVDFEDLYQLGCVGFLKAIDNFNTDFDVRFSTYAVPMIAGEIKRFLRDDGTIKVSRALKSLSGKINRFIEDYKKTHEEDPSISLLANTFEIEESEVVLALESAKAPISISEKDENHEKSLSVLEKFAAEDGVQDKMLQNVALKQAITLLPEKEQKIILLRYYFGKTQSEIASLLNVSQVQISRIENKALAKIRQNLE